LKHQILYHLNVEVGGMNGKHINPESGDAA